jgi:peptide/nickel transport system substrate-binding protein/oligopeptide transport system substrate-binding protein
VNERDPQTLDPARFTDFYDAEVGGLIQQGLVRFGDGTDVVPALAESWEFDPDGKSMTFYLREAKFHDGSTLDAYDVKYSITRVLDPETNSRRTWIFEPYLVGCDTVSTGGARAYTQWVESGMQGGEEADPGVEGIKTPDESTVVFHFHYPYLPFLTMLAMPNASILPLGAGLDKEEYPGAGPWKLDRWDRGERLKLTAFNEYWEGPAATPKMLYRVIAEQSTWRSEFESGNVDWYTVGEADYRIWRNDAEKQKMMVRAPELNIYMLAINNEKPPFDDIRVRKAINLAIDVEEIFQFIQLGKGVVAHGPVPKGLYGYQKDRETVGYDPEEAKRLVAEAGVEGKTIDLYYANLLLEGKVCQVVKSALENVGFQVQIRPLDRAAFRQAIREGKPDLWMTNWFADYPDIENFILPLFSSSALGDSNWVRYSNKEVDDMIKKARFNADPDERIRLFQQAEDQIVADMPAVFLWHRGSVIAVQPRIENYFPHIMLNGLDYHNVAVEE